jgi:environmental stress-induced protein Ves
MTLRHLRAAERVAAPWRNGGGVTREVIVHPAGADLASFDWRVSIAEVASDGPFSAFPGIDRLMAVLSGAGVRLEVEGAASVTVRPGDPPAAFPGDARTSGFLLDGPIRDLNVMTRRGAAFARMRRLEIAEALEVATVGAALLLWEAGEGWIEAHETRIDPDPLDAIFAERAGRIRIGAVSGAALWFIDLSRD